MSLGGQNKALIVLITETSVQLLLWQQNKLSELLILDNSKDDQELFLEEIVQYPDHPVIIIADLIDENFRHDTIVHVGGSDRDALLKRKLDFSFRNTRYRLGKVIGRNADGRKDDKVLLSAITKPERIDIWSKLLLQEKMAVQSVTSIAHLLTTYVPLEKLDQEEYLIIAQLDSDNNLRQTFINKGTVIFSRLASLGAVPEDRLSIEILQESTQLRQYLERIQFIPYESHLKLQVLTAIGKESISFESHNSELNEYTLIDVGQPIDKVAFELKEKSVSPAQYLIARILSNKSIDNVYAPASLTRYSDLNKFAKMLLVTAATILVLGLGLNIPGLTTWLDQKGQAEAFAKRIIPLQREYETLTQSFPATPIPPREMELIVKNHESIAKQVFSPIVELNQIASALAVSPGLNINEITWEVEQKIVQPGVDYYGNPTNAPPALSGIDAKNKVTGLILQERTQIKLIINGVAYSPNSFRDAQTQVVTFIDALSLTPNFEVTPKLLPINLLTDTSVSTTLNDSEVSAKFALEVIVEKIVEPEQLAEANL